MKTKEQIQKEIFKLTRMAGDERTSWNQKAIALSTCIALTWVMADGTQSVSELLEREALRD